MSVQLQVQAKAQLVTATQETQQHEQQAKAMQADLQRLQIELQRVQVLLFSHDEPRHTFKRHSQCLLPALHELHEVYLCSHVVNNSGGQDVHCRTRKYVL